MKKYLYGILRLAIPCFILMSVTKSYAQGTETFETQNVLKTAYSDGNFQSEVPGVTVNFVHARNEGLGSADNYSINGKGIMLRRADELSSVEFVIPNGVDSFSFNYRKAFTGNNPRQLSLLVDGSEAGITPPFGTGSGADAIIHALTVIVNKPGEVRMKITYPAGTVNGNRQTTIDNVSWTAFSGTPQPNITIQGNSITIPNGDSTPTTSDGTDFGTMIGGTDVERTFEIRNAGSATLNLTSPAVRKA